jgi:aspartokinase-like uncharacterized kinase
MSRSARWDLVVKVGGSFGRRGKTPLRRLMRGLERQARRERILVVPGGGRYADRIRAEKRRLRLPAEAAHRMALRAMDQYGVLLAACGGSARAVTSLREARRVAAEGGLPVLLAAHLVESEPRIERSFRFTSDAIAAWIARRVRARRLVLYKSIPGIALPVADREDARRLARRGLVDPLFADFIPAGGSVWLLDPLRVAALRGKGAPAPPLAVRSGRRRTGRPAPR